MVTPVVAGIDVGGPRKGFHLVVLQGETIRNGVQSDDPEELVAVCTQLGVRAIGVDAPCLWASDDRGRLAEKQMAKAGISCFITPTRERALASTSGFYDWMLNGERLCRALSHTYHLLEAPQYTSTPVFFETFPHAITCAFLGTSVASAKLKRTQRRQLLETLGIATAMLKSIDAVDAALCALAAKYWIDGRTVAFGDRESGYIVVPDGMNG